MSCEETPVSETVKKSMELLNELVRVKDAAIAVENAGSSCPEELLDELRSNLIACPVVIFTIIARHPEVVQAIRLEVNELLKYTLLIMPEGQITVRNGIHIHSLEEVSK